MINFLDTKTYGFISRFINMPITNIMNFASFLGSATVLIAIVFILFLILKDKKNASLIAINLASVFILNRILKIIVRRERPNVLRLAIEKGYSFPSGHAMVAFGFYGFIIYLLYKNMKNIKKRNCFIALLSFLILLIGVSRIYLGVHYATDILGAYIFAIIYLIAFTKLVYPKICKTDEEDDDKNESIRTN